LELLFQLANNGNSVQQWAASYAGELLPGTAGYPDLHQVGYPISQQGDLRDLRLTHLGREIAWL
jgi:hypothetical protein